MGIAGTVSEVIWERTIDRRPTGFTLALGIGLFVCMESTIAVCSPQAFENGVIHG